MWVVKATGDVGPYPHRFWLSLKAGELLLDGEAGNARAITNDWAQPGTPWVVIPPSSRTTHASTSDVRRGSGASVSPSLSNRQMCERTETPPVRTRASGGRTPLADPTCHGSEKPTPKPSKPSIRTVQKPAQQQTVRPCTKNSELLGRRF